MSFTLVSFGGGVDSTAMLIGLVSRGIHVDYILFSDTGGERQETYDFINIFSDWLEKYGYPRIITVKYYDENGELLTLEQDVLNGNTLPAIAFGWKSCSQKFKIRPINKWIKQNATFSDVKPIKYIGFEKGEERRVKPDPDGIYENRYPLIEWGWTREKAKQVIIETGLPLPPKSSCFFCPNMKKREVLELPKDLQERAIKMEENATKVSELKGLGRQYAWKDLIKADQQQLKMFEDTDWVSPPCECID